MLRDQFVIDRVFHPLELDANSQLVFSLLIVYLLGLMDLFPG